VCNCDGFNNLYKPKLICIDDEVGKITSKVHSYEDKSAQMLIQLAETDIQKRSPTEVNISSDWIICLSIDCGKHHSSVDIEGSGILPNISIQEFPLYIKNISCKNVS